MSENKEIVTTEEIEILESGAGEYKFKKPAKIDGEIVETIKYDFNEITGENVRKARSELGKRGYVVSVKELDECYHAALFAEAAGITYADVERFSMADYTAVASIASAFLNGEA